MSAYHRDASNPDEDSDDTDNSYCEMAATMHAPLPTPGARSSRTTNSRRRMKVDDTDNSNDSSDSGSELSDLVEWPLAEATASSTNAETADEPPLAASTNLRRTLRSVRLKTTNEGDDNDQGTSSEKETSGSPSVAVKTQQPSDDVTTTTENGDQAMGTPIRTRSGRRIPRASAAPPRRRNVKRESLDEVTDPVDLTIVDNALETLAQERKATQDRLLNKALFGSKKKRSLHPVARGPRRIIKVIEEKAPSLPQDVHVAIINASCKAIGRESEDDSDDREEEIADQAYDSDIPLMLYMERIQDLENVLNQLPGHQRFALQAQRHLKEKLDLDEIPAYFTDVPLVALQEDMEQVKSEETVEDLTYEKATDSYHSLFCVQCSTFDCPFHQLEDKEDPSTCKDLAMEAAMAALYDERRAVKTRDVFARMDTPYSSRFVESPSFADAQPLSLRSQFALSRMQLIFQSSGGNTESLQAALGGRYSREDFHDLPSTPVTILNKNAIKKPSSRKMPPSVERRIMTEAVDKGFFFPCSHEGMCSDKNKDCSCVELNQLCTKQCIWGKFSANLFTGCDCTGGCKTTFRSDDGELKNLKCTCALAAIECDPEICNCRSCQNQKITKHRDKRFLIAPSTILGAGTGLFTRYAIAKDDFVAEVSEQPFCLVFSHGAFSHQVLCFPLSLLSVRGALQQGRRQHRESLLF